MAKIVTVQLLVNDEDDDKIETVIEAAMQDVVGHHSTVLDYRLKDSGGDNELYLSPVLPEIQARIDRGIYAPGDVFKTPAFSLPAGKDYDWPEDRNADKQRECIDSIWISIPPPSPVDFDVEGVTGTLSVYIKRTWEGAFIEVTARGCEDDGPLASIGVEYSYAAAMQIERER